MRRIETKLAFTYAGVAVLVIVGVGLLSMYQVESYFMQHLVKLTANRADEIALLLANHTTEDSGGLTERLRQLEGAAGLRVTLIDSSGKVIADSEVPDAGLSNVENHLGRPEIQEAMQKGIGSNKRHSATVAKDFLYVAKMLHPLDARGALASVRFIRLSMHMEDVNKSVAEIRFNIILAGLLVLVLVLGVSAFVSRRISRPMVRIAEGIREIRSGNLDQHIQVEANDEIGQVAQAVNEMVDKLKSDIVQLKKLERVRSEFLGNVSHELRTPLFSMQGFLETLLDGAIEDPKVNRDFIQRAFNHSVRLNTLLGDLITISQIESGEMKMSFRYFKLREFLDAIVREHQPTGEHNRVQVKLETPPTGDVEVLGDKDRLRVVIDNLVQNAIKYNKPGGEVAMNYQRENGKVRVSVSDTGVGIEAEHLPRIFERFYRVDKNRSREVGGTGLGLAIVKHIVEAHEGAVRVESEPGRGSTFSFTLKT
jgi:two-component system phosphate regulon sensor histidine kinase PhoR